MEFELRQNNKLLGTLRPYSSDMFWINCKFKPTEAFQAIKPLFKQELLILDREDIDKWEEAYSHITDLNLELINLENNSSIEEFLLHIQEDEAWFRH